MYTVKLEVVCMPWLLLDTVLQQVRSHNYGHLQTNFNHQVPWGRKNGLPNEWCTQWACFAGIHFFLRRFVLLHYAHVSPCPWNFKEEDIQKNVILLCSSQLFAWTCVTDDIVAEMNVRVISFLLLSRTPSPHYEALWKEFRRSCIYVEFIINDFHVEELKDTTNHCTRSYWTPWKTLR